MRSAGKLRIMLDRRKGLAYIRILQEGWPRLPADHGTVHEALQIAGSHQEPPGVGHVCLRLLTSRFGRIHASTDDGRRRRGRPPRTSDAACRRSRVADDLGLASPRRGGASPRVSRICREGLQPEGCPVRSCRELRFAAVAVAHAGRRATGSQSIPPSPTDVGSAGRPTATGKEGDEQ